MSINKEFSKIKNNQTNVSFFSFCQLLESFNFIYCGGKGSHRIYKKAGIIEMVNIQNVDGKVKPYQIKQFIKIVEKYNLMEIEDE